MTLFINAMNVHQGGGRALFMALVDAMPVAEPVVALVDARLAGAAPERPGLTVRSVPTTVLGRLAAERWLSRTVQAPDTLLCFGNLPPLFASRGQVVVFLQNRYLVDGSSLAGFAWPARLRLAVERVWFRARARHAGRFTVQTPTMRAIAERSGRLAGRPVAVTPFVAETVRASAPAPRRRGAPSTPDGARFAYIASAEPHKNHRVLLEAWRILAAKGLRPSLDLTVAPSALATRIDELRNDAGLRIDNHGTVAPAAVREIYARADALIFPSTSESFGIPLLEAQQAGLPIIASELDYVRDVVSPVETFDPASPVSIARAVMRFLGCDEPPMPPLSAAEFLAWVLEKPRV